MPPVAVVVEPPGKPRRPAAGRVLAQTSAKLMVFTLVRAASKTWRKLNGTNQLPRAIEGATFIAGVAQPDAGQDRAA